MKLKSALLSMGMLLAIVFGVGSRIQAGEIVYADDIRENVITTKSLVRATDNIIVLIDTSSSMDSLNKKINKSYYEIQKEGISAGIRRLPDLDYNIGIYRFTPWGAVYPIQKFNETGIRDALKKLPEHPIGATPLLQSLDELESVLKGLSGKTFVYLFSDGSYDRVDGAGSPGAKTSAMAKKYDVCFQVIDYSVGEKGKKTINEIAQANACSRVIPFDAYITQPYYGIGPLFYTKWDTEVITTSEKKVAGYKVKNINFEVNQFDLSASGQDELNALAKFMGENPSAYAVLFGFTDATGAPDYNMGLSRRRADAVAGYLSSKFNLGPDRVIPIWYGEVNPIASNDTSEGRAKNRRVEVSIGGL